jgi:multiple sugar transport system ATP-binding protein
VLEQCDVPRRLYEHPRNAFVATFIGSPAMNLVRSRLEAENGAVVVRIGETAVTLPPSVLEQRRGLQEQFGRDVIVGVRPEDIEDAALVSSPNGAATMDVRVALAESTGAEVIAYFPVKAEAVGGQDDQRRDLIARRTGPGETTLAARLGARTRAQAGEPLRVSIDASRLHFFDAESESAIW